MDDASKTVDFFISYTQKNKNWAEWIAWNLEEKGNYKTILQAWDFNPAKNFVTEMDEAAKSARRTIAILSPDYLNSGFAKSEWAVAFAQDPTGEKGILLPILVEECDIQGVLGQIVYIDLVNTNSEDSLSKLLSGVVGDRSKPKKSPEFPASYNKTKGNEPKFPKNINHKELKKQANHNSEDLASIDAVGEIDKTLQTTSKKNTSMYKTITLLIAALSLMAAIYYGQKSNSEKATNTKVTVTGHSNTTYSAGRDLIVNSEATAEHSCQETSNNIREILSENLKLGIGIPFHSDNGKVTMTATYKKDEKCTLDIVSLYNSVETRTYEVDSFKNVQIMINQCKYIVSMLNSNSPITCKLKIISDNG